MSRKLISNVEKLSGNYMFCSCMDKVMTALDENREYDFDFFAGVTGDFFMQTWSDPKWQYNSEYSLLFHKTQEPVKAAFDACGYEYEYIDGDYIQKNTDECIRKIVKSIDKGFPVLTFGIVGPPVCSIIIGYDENGAVLIGRSQFTDEPKENNPYDLIESEDYFHVRDGLNNSGALIFFTKKKLAPSVAESIKKSILNIPKLAAFPSGDNNYLARQGFEQWADSLLCDEYFQDADKLGAPLDTYGSCIVMVGTNMSSMEGYFKRALELCPDMSGMIQELRDTYKKENEALQKLIAFQGGYFFDADHNVLLNKEFRVQLAKLVRLIGKYYEDAADVIR